MRNLGDRSEEWAAANQWESRERYMWRRGLLGPFYVFVRSWMFCWRIGDALGRSKHVEKDEISIADNTPVRTMLSV